MDARNSASGEIVFKDNFSQAVAGIVEVFVNLAVAIFLVADLFSVSVVLLLLSSGSLPRKLCSARYMPWPSVCVCVCLSQVRVLLKWLNIGTRKQCCMVAQGL